MALSGLLWLAACGAPTSHTALAAPLEPQESFDMAMNVPEDELSDMRGGFAGPGGLHIGFGLTTSTAVNGTIVSNFTLSSNNLTGMTPQNLQQLVQVGSGNTLSSSTPTTLNNSVITLIQNNVNNATIQNKNVLSINVSNLAALRNNTALLSSFGPLIRALH
jgi:hypothetical protein